MPARSNPQRRDVALTALNVLLGLGTALSPLLIALFLDVGEWWYLPLGRRGRPGGHGGVTLTQPLVAERAGADAAPPARRSRRCSGCSPPRSCFYGVAETMFGNWGTTLLVGDGVAATSATYALAAFWAAVTVGRLVIALVADRLGSTRIYVVLPWAVALALVLAARGRQRGRRIGLFAFAGLGCSGFFPMTVGYGESTFTRMVELPAGWLIAAYQIGYGLAAFGGGALQTVVSLSTLFRITAALAVVMGLLASPIARRQHPGATARRRRDRRDRRGSSHWGDGRVNRLLYRRGRTTVRSAVDDTRSDQWQASDHYDVIVVGTGAGGGTLAHTRRRRPASGSSCSSAVTSCPARRENWRPEPVFVDGPVHLTPETWYDADGDGVPAAGALLRRRRHQALRRGAVPPAPEDFGEIEHVDGVSPAWPLTYDDFEPWYTKAEWLYQVHGNHGEDPTEGPWSKQYPWPAVSHEPRIQEIADDARRPPATTRSRRRAASCSTRRDRARSSLHPLHVVRRLPVPRARQVRRRDDRRRARCSTARTSTLLVGAEVLSLETDPTGRTVTGVVRARATERRRSTPPTSWSCRPGRRTAPSCCCGRPTITHPNGLANGSDQVGRNYMFHNSKAIVALAKERNDTVFQKTLAINDFYLDDGEAATGPLGNIQMVGKSNGWAMKGEEPKLTKLAPHWTPRRRRPPRRRLLADDRGPPGARQPGDRGR